MKAAWIQVFGYPVSKSFRRLQVFHSLPYGSLVWLELLWNDLPLVDLVP